MSAALTGPAPPKDARPAATIRAQYAAQLLTMSERIVGAVYDDGPDELLAGINAALTMQPPAGVDPVVALVTVLAAQIPVDTTAEQRVGWTRFLGQGRTS